MSHASARLLKSKNVIQRTTSAMTAPIGVTLACRSRFSATSLIMRWAACGGLKEPPSRPMTWPGPALGGCATIRAGCTRVDFPMDQAAGPEDFPDRNDWIPAGLAGR